MKRSIALISLVLALLMLASACGSATTTTTTAGTTAGATAATTQGATTAATSGKITNTDVTLRLVRSDNSAQPMKTDSLIIQEIYKRTGVKLQIEAIPGSDFSTKTQTMIATNAMPDILYDTYNVPDFASTGVFETISDHWDIMPNIKKLMDATPDLKKLYIDNKLYYVPVLGRYVYRFGRSAMIRQDLLQETGLATPKTFDDLYAALKAIKAKHPDVYPMANRNGTSNLFICMAYSLGSGYGDDGIYFDPDVNGGTYLYGPAHKEFTAVLDFFAKLYKDKLLDPDYATSTGAQWQEKLSSGRSVFFFDNPTFATNYNKALAATNSAAKFAPLATPAYADGKTRGLYYNKNDLGCTTVSSKSKNKEVALKFLDYIYSENGCDLTNFGVEGQTYDKVNGKYVIKTSVVDKYKTQTDPLRAFYGDIGGAKLGLARYIDERASEAFYDKEVMGWYDIWAKWDFMDEMVINPSFTAAENEKLKEYKTKVKTILDAEYDKFIMGTRPISEFAAVQQQIIDAGALKIEEIYNAAAARSK